MSFKHCAALLLVSGLVISGCTLRYSKQMDDYVPVKKGGDEGGEFRRRVALDSNGIEVLFVQVRDVDDPVDLLKTLGKINDCRSLKNVEIDYRNFVMILVNLPRVIVSADCESKVIVKKAPKRILPSAQAPESSLEPKPPEEAVPEEPRAPILRPPIAPGQ
jgi:hypothetical protein